ncbi:MAG: hypothetical protein NZ777_13030 [Pseudomonadales bacterium]|nr:hypothetical protein [Pseudomonadales bacterium]
MNSEVRLASVACGPLQVACDVLELAAFVCGGLLHLDVCSSELRRQFIFGVLDALHIFGVANKIWLHPIDIGRLIVVDEHIRSRQ